VEYFVREPAGIGPWPTVVFLHGHQAPPSRPGGEVFVRWGVLDRYAERGFLAVSVSLPGYGGSSGPEDFAGPFTQHAVEAVLSRLEAQGQADADKVLIQGISLGAVTGALVAARQRRIAGLVLISGLYDLPAFFAKPGTPGALQVRSALMRHTGGGDQALRARSALLVAQRIRARTLILNGAKDDRTDPDQARRLAEVIEAHGGEAQVRIYPELGHEIPVKVREAEVDAFIAATLGTAERPKRTSPRD
jgi:dipeptidyl aminopeptidase/acylaminoacyl peptidase